MDVVLKPFESLLEFVVDNRGRTCPVSEAGKMLIATNCISNTRLYPTKESTRFVNGKTYKEWFRAHPKPGDILFVTKGTPGRLCLVPDPVNFCIAQDMVAVRVDQTQVDRDYLFAALRSEAVQRQIENMHVGTMIPHFKKGDFDKLLIPVPDRATQELIGSVYLNLSKRIELNRCMNETLEAMARAIFKDWFIDFGPTRAKMEGGAHYLASEIWSLFPDKLDDEGKPVGWGAGSLADIATLNPESWTRLSYPQQVEYVDLSSTKWGTIESTELHSGDTAPSRAQRVLRIGDTIVGTVRPGNGSYAYIGQEGLTGSTGFAVLRPRRREYWEMCYLAATSSENIERLTHLADGAAYPAVHPEVVLGTRMPGFSDEIIDSFSRIAKPLISRIEANKSESRTIAQIRDLLLPKLMSGEIRLREAEKLVEKVA